MSSPTDPTDPRTPTGGGPPGLPPEEERQDRRAAIAIVAVLALVAVAALVWWLVSDDDDEAATTTTSTTAVTSSSVPTTEDPGTTAPSSAPPTSFDPTLDDDEHAAVVWPDQDTSRRFSDPTSVAFSFATESLGFSDPVVGEFAAGDSNSGEVELRAREGGPVTTVMVRQFDDDSWWILGAQTPDIVLEAPEAGASVTSPLQVAGQARGAEGTVQVAVRVDGSEEPVGSTTVTGGAGGELAPFSGEVTFDAGDATWGSLALTTVDEEGGGVLQATVVRIRVG